MAQQNLRTMLLRVISEHESTGLTGYNLDCARKLIQSHASDKCYRCDSPPSGYSSIEMNQSAILFSVKLSSIEEMENKNQSRIDSELDRFLFGRLEDYDELPGCRILCFECRQKQVVKNQVEVSNAHFKKISECLSILVENKIKKAKVEDEPLIIETPKDSSQEPEMATHSIAESESDGDSQEKALEPEPVEESKGSVSVTHPSTFYNTHLVNGMKARFNEAFKFYFGNVKLNSDVITMTNDICVFYNPEDKNTPCCVKVANQCGECGVYICGLTSHSEHICLEEPRCCYCKKPAGKGMHPCHNESMEKQTMCSAYYCQDCVTNHRDEIVVRSARADPKYGLGTPELITRCMLCPKEDKAANKN